MLDLGLRVRGTGEGQRVKGHKWERTIEGKLEAKRKAMEGMPELIRRWKQVSVDVFRRDGWRGRWLLTECLAGSWERVEEISKVVKVIAFKYNLVNAASRALYHVFSAVSLAGTSQKHYFGVDGFSASGISYWEILIQHAYICL